MFNKDSFSANKRQPIKMILFGMVFIAFFSALSFVVMFLWNAILPGVTGVGLLSFWQAAGLLILSKILFGGFKSRKRHWKYSGKNNWRDKWMKMNDEERKEARLRWKEYCKQRDFNKK